MLKSTAQLMKDDFPAAGGAPDRMAGSGSVWPSAPKRGRLKIDKKMLDFRLHRPLCDLC